ncbi:alpha-galactosidase [Hypnocyclicus thermotrophus]|uniref:Alpha-galactosidase n=1 Tax=Hypnocyclicus thermotrophus TaxID=1627895 RepID=A0AA46E0K9_9FUSO|nr:glycoside hydrolase family 36 protein [Hypnocyclicus thermotrophus]TDT72268.1 alpha-galactosidase [Hypnocyclicus thermotrophus]
MKKFKIIYKVENKKVKKEIILEKNYICKDFSLNIKSNGNYIELLPNKLIIIEKVLMEISYEYIKSDKIFINGYQSWSDSKEVDINYKERKFNFLISPIVKKYKFKQYGDYNFYNYKNRSGIFHSSTYTYIKSKKNIYFLGSLNDYKSFTFIEHNTKQNKITFYKDLEKKEINSKITLFNIINIIDTNESKIFEKYFDILNLEKKENKKVNGWCSWYNYYENITEKIILKNLDNFFKEKTKLNYFQIDDGYQNAVGDWLLINNKFPKGMKYLAQEIKNKGYKPGIWLAPFAAEKKSILVSEHPEWILKDENGKFVYGGSNWSGFYALDIYNSDFREYLKNVFDVMINQWGYKLFKLDFLYVACLIPRKDKTRAEIMRDAMLFLREIIGDKEILGCGVPLVSAFGVVDYCRIGCDIGLDWDDKWYMKYMHRERISTKNAIRNSIYRYHMNGFAFYNDPDVFLLREDNISLSENEKETLFWINNIFGTLVFTSDNISKYNKKQKKMYKFSQEIKSREILNVKEENNIFEIKVKLNSKKNIFYINLNDKKIKYKNIELEKHQTIKKEY